jgi:hypothetical protein
VHQFSGVWSVPEGANTKAELQDLLKSDKRGLMREEFYFLSDEVLMSFERKQGYEWVDFPGARIERAYLILAECEYGIRESTAKREAVPAPDRPLLPGGMYLVYPEHEGRPRKTVLLQTYMPRWKV